MLFPFHALGRSKLLRSRPNYLNPNPFQRGWLIYTLQYLSIVNDGTFVQAKEFPFRRIEIYTKLIIERYFIQIFIPVSKNGLTPFLFKMKAIKEMIFISRFDGNA
uniref:Uncharacterized protein n=1 Tax=Populus davidiana TaxID=266767 RepID=A0A6M2EHJ3_9ROSI